MINSTLCYIDNGSSYLMLHRVKKKNDINHDKWIGVGGKLEEGESPEECARREVLEETGLTLGSCRFRGILFFFNTMYETEFIYVYSSDDYSGVIKECDEGELEWVNKEDVTSLPIWEGDRIFLDLLVKDSPFFTLKLEYEGDTLVSYDLRIH
ncbi:MAG: 8-oxo-dGTP diphosphatase [Oscillospiraceae bacterium]|nr:8-oxo-dGTP diphosphatase [Oscillospiraceae bacterium]